MWDVTCVATLAPSNVNYSVVESGAAAAEAEREKCRKYRDLDNDYIFMPLGFETLGHWGPSTVQFVNELGRLIAQTTGEPRAVVFLRQRLSIAIQRGNAVAVRGTVPEDADQPEIFSSPFDS